MARPNVAPAAWQPLLSAYGGVRGLSKALGIHEVTLNHWYNGRTALDPARREDAWKVEALRKLATDSGVSSPV